MVIASLLAYALAYGLRWRTARREGGPRAAGWGRATLWGTGIALLFVALISPIDRLGEQFATFHMVQHLLIADLAPVALTLALTKWILRPALPRHPAQQSPRLRRSAQRLRPSTPEEISTRSYSQSIDRHHAALQPAAQAFASAPFSGVPRSMAERAAKAST